MCCNLNDLVIFTSDFSLLWQDQFVQDFSEKWIKAKSILKCFSEVLSYILFPPDIREEQYIYLDSHMGAMLKPIFS